MKLREYLASKAVSLCIFGIAIILWGVFAYLCGSIPVLLWGSEAIFILTVVVRYTAGYIRTDKSIKHLNKIETELEDEYLLGEILPKPHDGTERMYFDIMKRVSRSAINAVQTSESDKNDYCDFVEQWIHELKTPLTACSLICDNGADPAKLKRELKRADNIADTALYYARLRTPENDTVITDVDIRVVLDEAVKSQSELLIAAGIGVEVDGGFIAPTDGKAVGFVVKQLLINCAKYCAGCHIAIAAINGMVTVTDNGPGIAAHELPRITRRGFTGEAGRRIGSTGMGLYISSEICKRLGISFSARSELGKGSEFTLCFDNLTKE